MLINYLAACAHLTITVSEIQRDIGRKSSIFSYPLAFDAPVKGVSVRIAPPRLVRKKYNDLATTRWKKIWRYLYSFWRNSRTWQTDGRTDRQTDGHRMPAIAALCMASHGKNQWCCAFNSLTPDTKIEFWPTEMSAVRRFKTGMVAPSWSAFRDIPMTLWSCITNMVF